MPRDPEVAPEPATSANAGPAAPPVEGGQAVPAVPGRVAGEDALRMPMPPGVPRNPPAGVDLATVRPLMGSAVPAQPAARSINIGGLVDLVREVMSRMDKLDAERAKFYIEAKARVDSEIAALKRQMENFCEAAQQHAEDRAREVGELVDARYAQEFSSMRALRTGVGEVLQKISAEADVNKKAAEAAVKESARVGLANTKIDLLAGQMDKLKSDLTTLVAATKDVLIGKTATAVEEASKALRDAGQVSKDFSVLNGRVQALENWRTLQARKGTGGRG